MIKKSLALILAALLICLCGCSGEAQNSPSSQTSSKPQGESDMQVQIQVPQQIVPEVNDYQKHTYNLAEITKYLKIDGRWATARTSAEAGAVPCITFDHSAQLLAFNADCEGDVVLKLSGKSNNTQEVRNERYYLVIVDGKESRVKVELAPNAESVNSITLATGLERGSHTFKVYRQTELNFGYDNLISVTMNGVPTERPADSARYIEFLGDSITAGFGNLTVRADEKEPSCPEKSSGTDTYAFKTAKALGADISAVAQSGLAYSYGLYYPIADYWTKISWARKSLGDYQCQRQPDVVVISLGTNDHNYYKQHDITEEQLYQVAYDLIKLVRESRPDSKIVWYYGLMGTGYDDAAGKRVKDYLAQAIEDNGGKKANIYLCLSTFTCYDGGGWHPDQAGHEKAAAELTAFIEKII